MIWDFIASVGFWGWYYVFAAIWIFGFAGLSWWFGEVTVKGIIFVLVVALIPIVNIVLFVLLSMGAIGQFMNEEKDITLWKRKVPE